MASRIRHLCEIAVLNHCPNAPSCADDSDGPALELDDWCSLCLLVHDVRSVLNESEGEVKR